MKILMINKFLYPNGGSETYMMKLGEYLQKIGHEVQYFGMDSENRCVGNNVNSYTANMNFKDDNIFRKIVYAFKTIYSIEARKKIRLVLDDFKPDVCHLNNFNYQLTPSIILEIVKWRRQNNRNCKIIYTAHDYQLICPNHMMNIPSKHINCKACIGGKFKECLKNRCIHNNYFKSLIGMLEAKFWNKNNVYKYIDRIICCSKFMFTIINTNTLLKNKTIILHNFTDTKFNGQFIKKPYVLYFGRYSKEKGVLTLINVAKELPNVKFVFAGNGEYKSIIGKIANIDEIGFVSGKALTKLIAEAKFTICPSEWYENCPLSIIESQSIGTVAIGSNIGGIPELVEDNVNGMLFESGDIADIKGKISKLWNDNDLLAKYQNVCEKMKRYDIHLYVDKYIEIINSI